MKILIVDDEPFFIDELKLIIDQFTKEAGIDAVEVTIVYSAEEALEIIPKVMPDCVFTDIKMNSMNGIDLAKKIFCQWPSIKIIIISGYPSFEYAKEAMRANVCDFLTKPVYDEEVNSILSNLVKDNRMKVYERIEEELTHSVKNPKIELDSEIVKMLDTAYQFFFPIHVKSFEGAYSVDFPFPRPSEQTLITRINNMLDKRENVWVLNDSNQGNTVIIISLNKTGNKKISSIVEETFNYFMKNVNITLVYGKTHNSIESLLDSLPVIRNCLYANLKIGKSIIINASQPFIEDNSNKGILSDSSYQKLHVYIQNQKWDYLKNEIMNLFSLWEREDYTCITIEQNLKKIVRVFEDHNVLIPITMYSIEKRLEEMVYISDSYKELQEAFWQLLTDNFYDEIKDVNKDTQQIFNLIKKYLINNIHEPITLTYLTDRFNISKTQLCALFRKEMDQSFVEHLTLLRMEKAKELMSENPDLLLKDVAQMVGYTDHYYFSRSFKHNVGVSPSVYKERRNVQGG
jgi:two-component system, response regulator YesN